MPLESLPANLHKAIHIQDPKKLARLEAEDHLQYRRLDDFVRDMEEVLREKKGT